MIKLFVGLGNPGPEYEATRHNAGFWWIDALAAELKVGLQPEKGFQGRVARASVHGHTVWLLQPQTFMNLSGRSVAALARFYKIQPDEILVAHDELDLTPGQVKLKFSGSHAGHNGLRDIHAQLGTSDYWRLRLGIGHPGDRAEVLASLRQLGYDPAAVSEDLSTPEGVGSWAGRSVMAFRENDGSNQLGDVGDGIYPDYTNYVAVNPVTTVTGTFTMPIDPNRWQPLRVLDRETTGVCATATGFYTQYYFTPQWGLVTPFALDSGPAISPTVGPPMYPDPEYEIQAREIVSISAALDDRQKLIAEYWEDGRDTEQPPGHWHVIAQFVSRRDGHTLDQDVRMFFALSNATLDAGIMAWRLKRQYDYVRPITAVRFLFNGQQIRAWDGSGRNAAASSMLLNGPAGIGGGPRRGGGV